MQLLFQPYMEHFPETHPVKTMPQISILVPVFNAEREIEPFIQSIQNLNTDPGIFEILMVDNGSSDLTLEQIRICADRLKNLIRWFREDEVLGSYASRNLGLEHAEGDLIAFTDVDCRPDPDWLLKGMRRFEDEAIHAVGGRVRFTFQKQTPNGAEWVDAQTNMQMERNIRERGVAKTANLFVRRSMFREVGRFRSDMRSGGDAEWTHRLTSAGYSLVYQPEAVVSHPASGYRALFQKQIRVGGGKVNLAAAETAATSDPQKPLGKVREILRNVPWKKIPGVLFAVFLVALGTLTGNLMARRSH